MTNETNPNRYGSFYTRKILAAKSRLNINSVNMDTELIKVRSLRLRFEGKRILVYEELGVGMRRKANGPNKTAIYCINLNVITGKLTAVASLLS